MNRVISTRLAYTEDKNKNTDNELIFPAHMQKVMMLPYMRGVKSCAFTKRVFHETLVS